MNAQDWKLSKEKPQEGELVLGVTPVFNVVLFEFHGRWPVPVKAWQPFVWPCQADPFEAWWESMPQTAQGDRVLPDGKVMTREAALRKLKATRCLCGRDGKNGRNAHRE